MKIPKKNALEWAVFGVSLVLLIGLIVFIIRDAAADQGNPAQINVELGQPAAEGQRFRVPVHVTNVGDEPAEEVGIEVMLGDETSLLTIGLLPSHSQEQGNVFFSNDPRSGELRHRVVGYLAP